MAMAKAGVPLAESVAVGDPRPIFRRAGVQDRSDRPVPAAEPSSRRGHPARGPGIPGPPGLTRRVEYTPAPRQRVSD